MSMHGALSINDFCQRYSIGRTKTYALIGSGVLPIVKIGKKTLIRPSDAEAMLDKLTEKIAAKPHESPDGPIRDNLQACSPLQVDKKEG